MTELTYDGYLKLETLLALQEPLSSPNAKSTRAAEHMFIVTHQASELWLSQVIVDVREATAALTSARVPDAEDCLARASAVLDLLAHALDALSSMTPDQFASFRDDLGEASGAQSAQFMELDQELGLGADEQSDLLEVVLAACRSRGATIDDLLQNIEAANADLRRVVLVLLDISRKVWKWKVNHIALVAKMLGHNERGTGGSSGTDYLAGRLAMPFGPLWDAVSALQRTPAGASEPEVGRCPHLAAAPPTG